jgi:hypothetical protein
VEGEEEDRVRVNVGQGTETTVFLIHKSLLTHFSRLAADVLANDAASTFTGELDLPAEDPEEFARLATWLYRCAACRRPPAYDASHVCPDPDGPGASPWCRAENERDCALAEALAAPDYALFALAHLAQHTRAVNHVQLARLRWALARAPDPSPLRAFVRHWLAWVRRRSGGEDCWAAFPDLAELAGPPERIDPRLLAVEHWRACSPARPHQRCVHRVVVAPDEAWEGEAMLGMEEGRAEDAGAEEGGLVSGRKGRRWAKARDAGWRSLRFWAGMAFILSIVCPPQVPSMDVDSSLTQMAIKFFVPIVAMAVASVAYDGKRNSRSMNTAKIYSYCMIVPAVGALVSLPYKPRRWWPWVTLLGFVYVAIGLAGVATGNCYRASTFFSL